MTNLLSAFEKMATQLGEFGSAKRSQLVQAMDQQTIIDKPDEIESAAKTIKNLKPEETAIIGKQVVKKMSNGTLDIYWPASERPSNYSCGDTPERIRSLAITALRDLSKL